MISSAAARTVTVVVAWLQVVLLAAGSAEAKCLSSGGPRADKRKLNVHLISHAHDDVGWLKTVDQYFYGQRNDFQHASVGNALDTIVQSLEVNPDRRFTFAEQAFFQRWWNEQNDERRNVTRQLVASGQLSFVLNGWAQHDEATPHFIAMLDQTSLGNRFLHREFNFTPRVSWQLDPFGHSATQAVLLTAGFGADSMFFGRIDYQDRRARQAAGTMEYVWRASPTLGASAQIFAGANLGGSYGPPGNLCWDQAHCEGHTTGSDPIIDDTECNIFEPTNVKPVVDEAVRYALQYSQGVAGTQNVYFMMGSDFYYENANEWYKNLDKLIHHVNADGRVNMFYSNPNIYTDSKHAENKSWTLKEDDNMPICQEMGHSGHPVRQGHAYWSGYFSTRSPLKRNVVEGSGYLQAARQLQLFARQPLRLHLDNQTKRQHAYGAAHWGDDMLTSDLLPLEMAVGLGTHHDGMTGTCKQHVSDDYMLRLATAFTLAEHTVGSALATLLKLPPGGVQLAHCRLLNESKCLFTAALKPGAGFGLAIYNPLALARSELIRVPVPSSAYRLVAAAGATSSVVVSAPPLGGTQYINTDTSYGAPLPFELQFIVQLLPLGLSVFEVAHVKPEQVVTEELVASAGAPVVIENEAYALTFGANGTLETVRNKKSKVLLPVNQDFFYYQADQTPGQGAGPYMFRPDKRKTDADGQNIPRVRGDAPANLTTARTGAGVLEVRQVFADWLTQVVRLPAGNGQPEFEMTVGPVPTGEVKPVTKHGMSAPNDGQGKEIIVRYSTGLATGGKWLTDSNGRELLERTRNHRPGYKLNLTEPQAANMHPIQTAIAVRQAGGGGAQLTVTPDRAQAGTSLVDGQVELLIHRRLLQDDGEGSWEALNETEGYFYRGCLHQPPEPGCTATGLGTLIHRTGRGLVIRARHRLSVDIAGAKAAELDTRRLAERVYAPVITAFAPAGMLRANMRPQSFAGASKLPSAVSLLTVEPRPDGSAFIRLAHKFGANENAERLSGAAVQVNLATLFKRRATSAVEFSLNGLVRTADSRPRHKWKVAGEEENSGSTLRNAEPAGPQLAVELRPMEVRAFVLLFD